jgi:ABC-type maltose transport system permease subunit
LEITVSSGLVGLIIFVSIIGYTLLHATFEVRLSLIAFLITAQFNPLSIAQIALFWLLLGNIPPHRKTH